MNESVKTMVGFASDDKKNLDPDLRQKQVLIVEDFFVFRLTLKKMLRSLGIWNIDDAPTGEEALQEMSYRSYDIVLCDHNLGPGKNGQQVLEEARLRQYIGYSAVFIIVTAENSSDIFMGSLDWQADDYLIKPITKEALEKKIRDCVRKKENLKGIEGFLSKDDYGQALNLCDELIAKQPRNIPELLKLKGEILINHGLYAEAADFYTGVTARGNLPWAMVGLGKARFFSGDYEDALHIFEEIIKKNPRIMAAHDMLAQTHQKMGDLKKSQQVLQKAIAISPRAVLRQRALGDVAYKNKDFSVAEASFKEAISQGKQSVLKSSAEYTSLAKVFIEQDAPEKGLSLLNDAEKEFPDNSEAFVQIAATEGVVLTRMNREKEARSVVARALQRSTELKQVSAETELELARALYLTGDEERASQVVKHLVQNNQDNGNVLGAVREVYREIGREEEGQGVIRSALNEIVQLNNNGVKLVRESRYAEAIDIFDKAAAELPGNRVINSNAAHAVMLLMQQDRIAPPLLEKAKGYLDAVKLSDPAYTRLNELMEMYLDLSKRGAAQDEQ